MSGVARLRLRRGVPLFDRVHAAFFGAGEQGIYMPSVHESFLRGDLFQDAAGTTPAALGQPVGLWLDRSGNGNHASQSTAAARPTLEQDANGMYCLRFDGVDDWLVTPSVNFTEVIGNVAVAGVTPRAGTGAANTVFEFGTTRSHPSIFIPGSGTGNAAWLVRTGTSITVAPQPYGVPYVVTGMGVLSGSGDHFARVNAEHAVGVPGAQGESRTNLPIIIGARKNGDDPATLFLNGDLYGIIICGAEKSLAQIELAENLINRYARAY